MRTAQEILKDALVFDTHFDLPVDLWLKHKHGRKNVLVEDYLSDFRIGCVDAAVAEMTIDTPLNGLHDFAAQISTLYEEVESSDGAFIIVRNTSEIFKARENGQIGLLLAIEGVDGMNADISLLRMCYELGIRMVGLCWSRQGWACDGSRFDRVPEQAYGVTEAGAEFIKYAEKLNIAVDVAHMNFKSFWDTVKLSTKPFICSHANSYTIAPTPRNVMDDQIIAIRDHGGYIGITDVSVMVRYPDQNNATLEDMSNHFAHVKKIGGADILALGIDQFDNNAGKSIVANPEVFDVMSTEKPFAAQAYHRLPDLVDLLMERGFTEEEIFGILGKNALGKLKNIIG